MIRREEDRVVDKSDLVHLTYNADFRLSAVDREKYNQPKKTLTGDPFAKYEVLPCSREVYGDRSIS